MALRPQGPARDGPCQGLHVPCTHSRRRAPAASAGPLTVQWDAHTGPRPLQARLCGVGVGWVADGGWGSTLLASPRPARPDQPLPGGVAAGRTTTTVGMCRAAAAMSLSARDRRSPRGYGPNTLVTAGAVSHKSRPSLAGRAPPASRPVQGSPQADACVPPAPPLPPEGGRARTPLWCCSLTLPPAIAETRRCCSGTTGRALPLPLLLTPAQGEGTAACRR